MRGKKRKENLMPYRCMCAGVRVRLCGCAAVCVRACVRTYVCARREILRKEKKKGKRSVGVS